MSDLAYEIIDIPEETEVKTPEFSDDVHDDVELMLNSTGSDILELIASDPKHYLDVVTRYNKTRDGRDIYLPDLFNLIIYRNPNEYRIKFKTTDNGNWYEVGYTGGNFTEDEVLTAFTKKVNYAINRPTDSHRSAILDTLLPGTKKSNEQETPAAFDPLESSPFQTPSFESSESPFMRPQGDQTKLSKIDRFMGRSSAAPATSSQAPVGASQAPVVASPPPAPVVTSQAPIVTSHVSIASSPPVVSEKKVSSVLSELDILRTLCPEERREDYERLVSLLRSDDLFYQSLIKLLPRMKKGQRILVSDFLLQN